MKNLEHAYSELLNDYQKLHKEYLEQENFIANNLDALDIALNKSNKFKALLLEYMTPEDIEAVELQAIEEIIYE